MEGFGSLNVTVNSRQKRWQLNCKVDRDCPEGWEYTQLKEDTSCVPLFYYMWYDRRVETCIFLDNPASRVKLVSHAEGSKISLLRERRIDGQAPGYH